MSEREWKPKVGDKVKVTGCETLPFFATINRVGPVDGWYLINHDRAYSPISAHIRNLDPVLEDERRGAPRPPIQDKEIVEITVPVMVHYSACDDLRIWQEDVFAAFRVMAGNPSMPVTDPRVRQIEHRKENKGREARKL